MYHDINRERAAFQFAYGQAKSQVTRLNEVLSWSPKTHTETQPEGRTNANEADFVGEHPEPDAARVATALIAEDDDGDPESTPCSL